MRLQGKQIISACGTNVTTREINDERPWNKSRFQEEQYFSARGTNHDFKGNKKISIYGTNTTTRGTKNLRMWNK
jgi:hypothetical protein